MQAASQTVADAIGSVRLISSDSHIVEPPDVWKSLGATFGERAPHVVAEADGDWWYVDAKKTMSFLGIQTGHRFEKDATELRTSGKFSDVRPGAYDPSRFIAENERDGIWASVIYPSQGLVLFAVPNSDLVSAAMRAYNDWIAEFCSHDPKRLKGLAMINVDDVDAAVAELERVHAKGLAGALITVAPPAWGAYHLPIYERLWAAAQDLGMPLSLHVGSDRADSRLGDAGFRLDVKNFSPTSTVNQDFQIRTALADMIYSCVFERFPRLRVGAVECELSWITVFLQRLDYNYTDRPQRGPQWRRFKDKDVLPSDFFRRNSFVSFQEDPYGMRMLDYFGVDGLMWGSDYPHTESTFPRSREILAEIFAGLPPGDIVKMVSSNAARLYGFDLAA
jgi:predicted TIM-barrel fold metal-dependent hydrolase